MLFESIDHALEWTIDSQSDDGGFPFPSVESYSACWLTSEAITALISCGIEVGSEAINNAFIWLKSHQNKDFGWPALTNSESTTESTSWGVLACSLSNSHKSLLPHIVDCLVNLQDHTGGWPRSKCGMLSTTMTSMAIMALESIVDEYPEYSSRLHQGYLWMEQQLMSDNGWSTLNSIHSDPAPASLFLFASRNSRDVVSHKLRKIIAKWLIDSGIIEDYWLHEKKWCSYETFIEKGNEWPRRKYFLVPFAIAGTIFTDLELPYSLDLISLIISNQSQDGQYILPMEVGEEHYTWYTYVTAYTFASLPMKQKKTIENRLENAVNISSLDSRYFIVSIGINEYDDKRLRTLVCAENDEEIINKWLSNQNNGIHCKSYRLSSNANLSRPTRSAILGTIGSLVKETNVTNSTIIFYYSGHGKNISGKDCLLPIDFTYDAAEDTAIDLDLIVSKIRSLSPRYCLLIIDACRDQDGKGIYSWISSNLLSTHIKKHSSIATILSCQNNEMSYEIPEANIFDFTGIGAFTLAFINTLSKCHVLNDSKFISVRDVINNLQNELDKIYIKYNKGPQHAQTNFENLRYADDMTLPMLPDNI